MTVARRAIIEGRVQGVFFRDWTVRQARAVGVTGWVRNCGDGSVEVMAVGEAGNVESFVSKLRQGSPGSRVDRVRVQDAPLKLFDSFERVATL